MINWFNHLYPYSNLHELNLDWVIATVKNGEKEIADFIGVNTIKYADPILWNIESQYEANTVVIDGQTGNAYISVKAVPSGVHINRTEYWTQIYNYANVVDTLRAQIAHNEGDTTTATQPFVVGDLVFVKTLLYRVIAPMIAGDSFVENSNIVKTTIEDELKANIQAIQSEASARQSADTQLQNNIDAETSARQSADTQLQSNIDSEASARQSADTQLQSNIDAEASARQSADTQLQSNIDAEASARQSADTQLQSNIDAISRNIYTTKIYVDSINGVDSHGNGSEATPYKTVDFAISDLQDTKPNYLELALKEGNYYLTDRVLSIPRLIIASDGAAYGNVHLYLNSYLTTEDFHYYGWLLITNLTLHGRAHMHGLCDMINVYGDSIIELDGGSAFIQNATFNLLRIHNEHCRLLGGLNITGVDEEPLTIINSFVQILDAITFNSNGNVNKNMIMAFASNISLQNVSVNISTTGIYAGALFIQDSQVFITPELFAQLGTVGINATRTDWVTVNRNPE